TLLDGTALVHWPDYSRVRITIDRLTTELAWATLAVAAGVFVVVEGLLVLAALRLRQTARERPRTARQRPRTARQRPMEALPDYRASWGRELLWTLLPAVGLLALGLLGLRGLLGAAPGP